MEAVLGFPGTLELRVCTSLCCCSDLCRHHVHLAIMILHVFLYSAAESLAEVKVIVGTTTLGVLLTLQLLLY